MSTNASTTAASAASTKKIIDEISLRRRDADVSPLAEIQLLEYIPKKRIDMLLESDLLHCEFEKIGESEEFTNARIEQARKNYANEVEQIKSYRKKYDHKLRGVVVDYKKPRHMWGRTFPFRSLGITSFRRKVRNTLIRGLYYDFDLSNAQPQIIRHLCRRHGVECSSVEHYCDHREEVLEDVMRHYSVSRKKAKSLFIRLCFKGTEQGWLKEEVYNNAQDAQVQILHTRPSPFVAAFQSELQSIAEWAKEANKEHMWETTRKLCLKKKGGNALGSFFGLFNQEVEFRVVEEVMMHLIRNTNLFEAPTSKKHKVGAYEYDGMKLLAENVDKFGGTEKVLELLNHATFDLTGFPLKWEIKDITDDDCLEMVDFTEVVDDAQEAEAFVEHEKNCNEIIAACDRQDTGIAEVLMKIHPGKFIYAIEGDVVEFSQSSGQWYCWSKSDNKWVRGDSEIRKAIQYDVAEHWESLMKPLDERFREGGGENDDPLYELWKKATKAMTERVKRLRTCAGVESVVKIAWTHLSKRIDFDEKADLFGCDNGVLDIANGVFRPNAPSDFVTFSCKYDFKPLVVGMRVVGEDGSERIVSEDDWSEKDLVLRAEVEEILCRIFPDEELRNYVMKICSTGVSGRAIERFYVFNGSGRNGKGVLNDLMGDVLGDYCATVSEAVLSQDPSRRSASGPNPELAKLDRKRYAAPKEPPEGQPIQNSVMKLLTGGGKMTGRQCNSNKTEVRLNLTLVLECNAKPKLAETPTEADLMRIDDILFASRFSQDEEEWSDENHVYPQNPALKTETWRREHRNVFLNMLLEHLFQVRDVGYQLDKFRPRSVVERSLAYVQNSFDIHNLFVELFEELPLGEPASGEEDWTLPAIVKEIRESSQFKLLSKKRQREYNASVLKEFFVTNRLYRRMVYTDNKNNTSKLRNWRRREIDEADKDLGRF